MVDSIYISQQLRQLEDAFYDGIDSQLLNHIDLSNFAFQMNKIITNIRKHLQPQEKQLNKQQLNEININYSQLEVLGKSNIKN